MAVIKSFRDIVNAMIHFLYSKRPNVDVSPGTFTRDVVIDTPSKELESLYLDLKRTSDAQSPDLASSIDIESLGRNLQLFRRGPLNATGIVSFYSFEAPSSPITIPRGTVVASKASTNNVSQQYTTTQDVILGITNFNVNTGRYEVDAPVRAKVAGTDGNVPPGSIVGLQNPIVGIAGVYNFKAFTNGSDSENLLQFRNRVKSVLTGNNVGTTTGYYQTITRIPEVLDARIASATSGIQSLRRADIGAVDIYVRGLISKQAPTESYKVPTSGPYEFIVSKQPIDLLAAGSFSLVGSNSGTISNDPTELIHYTIVQDTGKFAESIKGADKFVFTGVTPGEEITIIYSYNSLIESLQLYMENDDLKVLGADLLIKSALPRKIDVSCTIRVLPGYVSQDIITSVTTTLTSFLNGYTIGEEVQQSDVLAAIANTVGVDDVTVPLNLFQENSETGNLSQDATGNLIIPPNSYAMAGTISVTSRI